MHVIVNTISGVVFDSTNVKSLSVPGERGEIGFLKNHSPIISYLKKGTISITDSDDVKHLIDISVGYSHVNDNTFTITTSFAKKWVNAS